MSRDLWPGVDLRHLAAFRAVAQTRSFARAAQTLGYSQPAVSQQVAALERIVGQRLVERSPGRAEATLTEAGELLLGHVDVVARRLTAARQDLADLARGEAGVLRVGSFQSASARILPPVLRRYHEARPAVRVDLVERIDDVPLLDDVAAGTLDFAFCLRPLDDANLDSITLVEDPYVLVARADDPAAAAVSSLEDVLDLDLLLHRSCRSGLSVAAHLQAQGREPRVVFRSDDNSALKEMVRAGVGVAILPGAWMELGGNDGLRLIPLEGLVPPRVVALAWRRERTLTPAQAAFADVAAEVCAGLAGARYAAAPAKAGMISSP